MSHSTRAIYVQVENELPSRLNADDRYLIQKYIENPLLLDGYRFDLRVYVAITSFNPLRIYMFEEGLVRVAAEIYDADSVGDHQNRTERQQLSEESYVNSNKWSLSALMRYIASKYGSDNASLIKSKIKLAKQRFQLHGNCFELLGFDIIIDEALTPWLLEVNFSPSLACDTDLDMKIKTKHDFYDFANEREITISPTHYASTLSVESHGPAQTSEVTEDFALEANPATSPEAVSSRGRHNAGIASSTQKKIMSSEGSAKKTAEKIQAREAFHVFLENILERLKKHYEQRDPDSAVDEDELRQVKHGILVFNH
ncbi:Tubulin polyglutamylase ttll5 [Phlyctochytrium bullatum]|nr:Tubulin polyglutamylase ttll5 [Phlyctochytrium bullatum]